MLNSVEKAFGKIKGYITVCPKCGVTALVALFHFRDVNKNEQVVKCSACKFAKSLPIQHGKKQLSTADGVLRKKS